MSISSQEIAHYSNEIKSKVLKRIEKEYNHNHHLDSLSPSNKIMIEEIVRFILEREEK